MSPFDPEDAKRYPSQTTGTYRAKRAGQPRRSIKYWLPFLTLTRKAQVFAAVIAFLIVTTQQIHAANANSGGDRYLPDDDSSAHVERSSKNKERSSNVETQSCEGADAFSFVRAYVDGSVVDEWNDPSSEDAFGELASHIKPGSMVRVSYKVHDYCEDVPVSLTSYSTNSATFNEADLDAQKLVAWASDRRDGGDDMRNLTVQVPKCFYQVDFATHEVIRELSSDNVYGDSLVGTVTGGTSCVRRTTTTTSAPVPVRAEPVVVQETAVCPTEIEDRIDDYSVTVVDSDGNESVPQAGLAGNVTSGSTVTVNFTVKEECNETLSLVSYEAQSTSTAVEDLRAQTLYRSKTGTFGPGEHSLTVAVPDCYFQVDFVSGNVIKKLGTGRPDSVYGDRLIDTDVGGEACAVPAVVVKTTTTTTEAPAQVEERTVIRETQAETKPVVVQTSQPTELAATGINLFPMFALGTMFVTLGALLLGAAGAWRRYSYWSVW